MKISVIVNPKSLNGCEKKLEKLLERKFNHQLCEVNYTNSPGHATRLAHQAVCQRIDTIVAVGGDGTVNEVLNGIAGTEVMLGIIPTGTANDLASLYHIPIDASQACDVILKEQFDIVDLISVNGWYFITSGGIGLPCKIAGNANTIKQSSIIGKVVGKILGSKFYILAALFALLKKTESTQVLNISSKDYSLSVDVLAMIVSNQQFLGKNFLIAPGAVNNDGQFDICLIENSKNPLQTLRVLIKVLQGKHITLPFVKTFKAETIAIDTSESLSFFADGEILQKSSQFSIRIVPKALRLLVPAKERSC